MTDSQPNFNAPMPTGEPTSKDLQELRRLCHRLATQDNRCTGWPAYCVQRQRIHCTDPEFIDNPDEIMWYSHDGEIPRAHWALIEEHYQSGSKEPLEISSWDAYQVDDLIRTGYRIEWETVQVCLTEEGAQWYIENNGHNISRDGAPRIYVESFYRNDEMIRLRDMLPRLLAMAEYRQLAEEAYGCPIPLTMAEYRQLAEEAYGCPIPLTNTQEPK